MNVRPYALLGDAVLAAVQARAAAAVAPWCRDWGLEDAALTVTCRRAWEGEGTPSWRGRLQAGEETAWLGWGADLKGALQRLMFAPDRHHGPHAGAATLAAATAGAALDALTATLGRALLAGVPVFDDAGAAAPAHLLAHGSGAVLVEIRTERHACWCLLDYDTVRRLAAVGTRAVAPLAAIDHRALLADQPVRLAVAAGRANVALGSLLSLAPGDVIRLDTLADGPLSVDGPDGTPLLRGYLGTSERQLALDIVAGDSTSSGVSA